jgi:hypothetical protein
MQYLLLHDAFLSRGGAPVKRPVLWLTAVLILSTCLLVLYRIVWLGYPVLPLAGGQTWQLTITAFLTPGANGGSLALALPTEHTGKLVVEERVVSGPYTFTTRRQGENRLGVWSGTAVRRPEEISYQATIHSVPLRTVAAQSPLLSPYPQSVTPEERRRAEEAVLPWLGQDPAVRYRRTVEALRGGGSGGEALQSWRAVQRKMEGTTAILTLLRAADLPARAVEGLRLEEGVQSPQRWIEVWTGRDWIHVDPGTLDAYPQSERLLPLAVGGVPAAGVAGAKLEDIRWTLSRRIISQWKLLYERIVRSGHFLDRWSLLQLPPEFQGTFRILLLVPLGALIVSLLRNVVGLPTFGIFMPLLIALAFRSTGTLLGVSIFCGVLLVGFAVRAFLDRLHLLLVPRLSVILTLVIACFTVLALLGNRFGIRELMAVGLIPFVILTLTIERFFILVEESGNREALGTAAGSMVVSLVSYGIISWDPLQLTFFVYPELILTVAALQILVGRYTGYRLSELLRFRSLGENRDAS